MNYETYCKIGEVIIKIISLFPFSSANGLDFECEPCEPDYTFYFKETKDIPGLMKYSECVDKLLWAHEYRKKDGTFYRAFLWNEIYYDAITELDDKEGICYYAGASTLFEKAKEGFELIMYLCIEQILLKFDALVLHSSHINVEGKGLVFSAPSQTGKSTQAELWKQHENAVVLNGDRSVLRKKEGIWHVYGCPMCGTSGIHLQGDEVLTNIVMLAQAKENQIKRIKGLEAFRLVYPQITIPKWDGNQVKHAIDLLNELLSQVPVWYYSCTKEPDAVAYLKEQLGF